MKKTAWAVLLLYTFCFACTHQKDHRQGEQSDVSTSTVKNVDWSKNANIYEVNIRQHTEEGTFKAFTKDIPRLKEMGVDILWLMPISPVGEKNRKGTLGSYYSITDYKEVNPEFGTKEDLRNLVNTAHDLNMRVMVDWVANHTAWDHPWTETNKDYYTLTESGDFQPPVEDWSDVIDLNYDNQEMRAEMIDALEYWVREFDIDGYRCDVAGMVPEDFWNDVRAALDKIKPVFMLAEGEETELHEHAFDMSYSWELMHLMREVAAGREPISVIPEMYERDKKRYPKGYYKMNIVTNHDENSWNGTAEEFFGEGQSAWFVFAATTYGMPLIYSGQEANNTKRLEFFEKDPIDWSGGSVFTDLYKKLLSLKHENPALWNGRFGGDQVFLNTGTDKVLAFTRSKSNHQVAVFINISGEEVIAQIDGQFENYTDVIDGGSATVNGTLTLPPFGYKVYAK